MLQVITIKIDMAKVKEYGTLILRVIPPRDDLPNGTILLHDPLGLPGFKMDVSEDAPTISIKSQFLRDELMPPTIKTAANVTTQNPDGVNVGDATPAKKPVMKLFQGKDKLGKKGK
jgi:hypothetical protein